jgi:hypothetical protein
MKTANVRIVMLNVTTADDRSVMSKMTAGSVGIAKQMGQISYPVYLEAPPLACAFPVYLEAPLLVYAFTVYLEAPLLVCAFPVYLEAPLLVCAFPVYLEAPLLVCAFPFYVEVISVYSDKVIKEPHFFLLCSFDIFKYFRLCIILYTSIYSVYHKNNYF